MKVHDIVNWVVRGLLGIGAVAVGMALLGWTAIAASPTETIDRSGVLAEPDPLQQTGLFGAVISSLGDREIQGYAVIFPTEDGGAEIIVDAHGVEPSVEHMQHIHSGASCSNLGGVLQPLEPYPQADDEGRIHYRETFDSMPENSGDRVIVIHGADGAPAACGEFDAVEE